MTEPTSSIGYEVCTLDLADSWLRLFYTFTQTKDALDYRIRLTTTCPRFGGLRWWFVCPMVANGVASGQRVGKFYLHGHCYDCRHCCQESHKYDSLYRLLARDTGMDLDTVKRAMDREEQKQPLAPTGDELASILYTFTCRAGLQPARS